MTPEPRTRRRTLRRSTAASLLTLAVVAAPAVRHRRCRRRRADRAHPDRGWLRGPPRSPASPAPPPRVPAAPRSTSWSCPRRTATPTRSARPTWPSPSSAPTRSTRRATTTVAPPFTGCTATLAVLLNRADALDPANSVAIDASTTDGIYVLGGDQEIAMDVLANTPAETAITAAVRQRGGGAGRHQRRGSRRVAHHDQRLQHAGRQPRGSACSSDSTLMWWDDGDADLERGLAVGSSRPRSSTSTSTSAAGSAARCPPSRPPTSGSAGPARWASASTTPPASAPRVTSCSRTSSATARRRSSTSRRCRPPTRGSAARPRSLPARC